MVNLYQIAPVFLAGVSFYVATFHLLLYFRIGKPQRISLIFSATCFTSGIYDLLCTGLYLAKSVTEGATWQQAQLILESFWSFMILLFLFEYTSHVNRRISIILAIFFSCVTILTVLNPSGIVIQSTVPSIKIIQIGPTLQVLYDEAVSGPIKDIINVVFVLMFCYWLWIALNLFRHGHRKEAAPLLVVFIIFFACATSDILVVSGFYDWFYMTEYGFLSIVVLMAFALSNTIVDSMRKYRQLFEDAEKVSEMKSDLITFVTHELKTPLVPIVGWAEFLKSGLEKGKQIGDLIGSREVESILNSATRLTNIIEKFLEMGHLESKEFALYKETCHLGELIQNAIETVTISAQGADINIHNNSQDETLFCDQFRMEQVFINILSNAIKYSPSHTEIWVTSETTGNSCKISFQDQGFGFMPEDIEKAFRPFWRGPLQQGGSVISSTGIGLYLAKVIVEQHSGTITISSPGPDQGTTVKIFLPLQELE